MSDNTEKLKQEFSKEMAELAQLEAMKEDTAKKRAILDNKRVNSQMNSMSESEKDLNLIKEANFDGVTEAEVSRIQNDNDEYLVAAKNAMHFITKSFFETVPFFKKNFILIGGLTGHGKSTTVANIVFSIMRQINPATGKGRRVLVITNEESKEDFYNRLTCLINGWHYVNHGDFTEKQRQIFKDMIPRLAKQLVVIDNNHNGSMGVTTSIEGIRNIFENLLANNIYYDAILIDYYQNITDSKENPSLGINEIQGKVARMMNDYKDKYPAPIVMMTQLHPSDKDKKTPFASRIKGRRNILDSATFAMEMERDAKNLTTLWSVHKTRFTDSVGKIITTGYKLGKFVENDNQFKAWASERIQAKVQKELDRISGQQLIPKKEENNGK